MRVKLLLALCVLSLFALSGCKVSDAIATVEQTLQAGQDAFNTFENEAPPSVKSGIPMARGVTHAGVRLPGGHTGYEDNARWYGGYGDPLKR